MTESPGSARSLIAALALALLPAAAGAAAGRDGTPAVTARLAMDAGPTGIGYGHGQLWVTRDDDTVVRLDPRSGRVRGITRVGRFPVRVAVGPRAAWVADSAGDTVSEVDVRDGRLRRTIPVGDQPSGVAVTDGAVWVVCGGEDRLYRIDPATGRVVGRIPIGPPADDAPDIAVGPSGVWATALDKVVRIDPSTGTVTATVPVRSPADVTVGPRAVWVAGIRDDAVTRIDPRRNAVTGRFRAGRGPSGVTLAWGRLWVMNDIDSTVSELDPSTGRRLARLTVGPHSYDIAVGGGAVWVQSYGAQSLFRIQLVRPRAEHRAGTPSVRHPESTQSRGHRGGLRTAGASRRALSR